jgi:hypothetical protein
MLDLHSVVAPQLSGRRAILTPERVALAAVAAFTSAATAPVAASIDQAARVMGDSRGAMLAVMATTATLAAALGYLALRAASEWRARIWLAIGGAGAGVLATLVSGSLVPLLLHARLSDDLLVDSVFGGGPLGFVFGAVFTPVVLSAFRASRAPSHDGVDRVVFAAGVTLLAFGALRLALPLALPGAALGLVAAVAGGLAALVAAARIVARVRLVARARAGGEPGFHVVPRSGREDEAPLVPLVRTAVVPAGVLAATGVSAAYRGARGVFKLALAPLPEQRFPHPVTDLMWAAATEGAHAILTLAVGLAALVSICPFLLILVFWNGMS